MQVIVHLEPYKEVNSKRRSHYVISQNADKVGAKIMKAIQKTVE